MQPEDVLCFAGAEEAIYLAMHVLLDPGDHAVVLTPNYQAAETIPLSICEVSGVPLRPEDGWALDVEAIEAALRPNTRLVSVNFPNNPTGAVADPAEWQRLADLCTERGITLFSDEVYRGLEVDRTPLPQAADLSPTAISLNVMSKAYGLPGLRIGWIACRDQELSSRLERAKHYTTICNSAPSEVLALIGLRARDALLDRNRRIVADNLPRFAEFFGRFPELFAWEAAAGRMRLLPALPRSRRRGGHVCRPGGAGRGAAVAGEHLPVRADAGAGRPVPGRRRPARGRRGPGSVVRLVGGSLTASMFLIRHGSRRCDHPQDR